MSTTTVMSSSRPPQVLIFGAGAVGAFYGALLARSSSSAISSSSPAPEVSVVCRSNFASVRDHGFRLTSPTHGGSWTWHPTHVYSAKDLSPASSIEWDYIVIATKALPDAEGDDAAASLNPLLSSSRRTTLVLIQNGLGVERPYTTHFPSTPLLSAVTVVSAAQPSSGHIAHNRWTRITVGPYGSSTPSSAAEGFCSLLSAGGVKDADPCSASDLQLLRWHKIAINAAMNPSSVLSGGTANGTMASDPELSSHLLGVMREVLSVAPKVCGVPSLPEKFATPEQILASTRKNTSGSRPSMWADWEQGKPLELEVILGAPIRAAREKGLEMPRLESMYALLKMAQRNRDAAAISKQSKL